jgi:3-dehydroquinate synthase
MKLPSAFQAVQVVTQSSLYPVICGVGVLRHLGALIAREAGEGSIFVLSSKRVWNNCGAQVYGGLRNANVVRVILFDDRESAKTLAMAEMICRKLIHAGARRDAVMVAVGGGVVGDVAGLAAATFLRGIAIIQVPTTLLAQVDSAIGGKAGVNLPEGKNLIGLFHQPKLVVCDPVLLCTLPGRQFRAGLFEVVKYAAIADASLLKLLEARLPKISRNDTRDLMEIIPRCLKIKVRIINKDEREHGVRATLNFGHTIGHALETAMSYRRFFHGEAVGWGMLAATLIAVALDRVDYDDAARLMRLIVRAGPLPALPDISAARLWNLIQRDKKSRNGEIRWVLPVALGRVDFGITVPEPVFRRAWRELPLLEAKSRR